MRELLGGMADTVPVSAHPSKGTNKKDAKMKK
jgi:hypothetical protein